MVKKNLHKHEHEEIKESKPLLNNIKKSYSVTYTTQRLSIKIAMSSIFAALAIGVSYALAPLVNIELMSVILFLSGFLYGTYVGFIVGLISSSIYYGWNPFGIPPLPLYIVMVACMVFIGVIGGLLKLSNKREAKIEMIPSTICKFALIGFFYTFLFDIVTNIVYAYFYYGGDILLAFVLGFTFMIIHLVLNTIIFAFLVIPIHNSVISIR